MIKKKKN